MRYPLLLCLLLFVFVTGAIAAPRFGQLQIKLVSIKHRAGGNLRVGLFRGEDSWPKFKNALQTRTLAVTAAQQLITFEQLPFADDYAIEVHHDENGNGKFDMRWFTYPKPKEGVGVSNNDSGFGHPDFDDARFSLDQGDKTVQIEMRY